ncbi:MAG: tRNA 2-thiouridine(34) synthase MnmA, partial [Chitinophagia bacterium]|nr:tRNA 2-thiouridine(34) synthase MnmA [Chitinophagia bacterium]
DEIRQMAFDWGYEALSKKPESYEICFVPDNDYRGFLKRRVPELEESVSGGVFVDKSGNVLGKHDGYPFYTVGQRKGLGGGFKKPMYVTEIIPGTNTVVLGEADELLKNSLRFHQVNHQKYEEIPNGREFVTMVRYNDRGTLSQVETVDGDCYRVIFKGNVRGVAPGQSAVVYEGEDLVGGGIIRMPQKSII